MIRRKLYFYKVLQTTSNNGTFQNQAKTTHFRTESRYIGTNFWFSCVNIKSFYFSTEKFS